MAEFKVSDSITPQIADFRKAGNQLNDSYAKTDADGVNTLNAANAYISQQDKLRALLDLYNQLVQKDAKDLDDMVTAAKALDAKLASGSK